LTVHHHLLGHLYLIFIASAAAPDQDEEYHGGKTNDDDIETCQITIEHFGHLTCFPFTLFYDGEKTPVTKRRDPAAPMDP
jgi:hypothetical protein